MLTFRITQPMSLRMFLCGALAIVLFSSQAAQAQTTNKPGVPKPPAAPASAALDGHDCVKLFPNFMQEKDPVVRNQQYIVMRQCRFEACQRRNALVPKKRKPGDPYPEDCEPYKPR